MNSDSRVNKAIKVAVILIVIVAASFLVYQQFTGKRQPQDSSEAMKKNIIAEAKIGATDLTEENRQKYLKQLKDSQETVVKFNFDNLQALNAVAQLKKLLGDLEGARIAWEYANVIRPNNSLSFSNLAALYHYDLKQYDKAEKNYLISIVNDPDDINTIRNLFELYYYSIKDNAKAEGLLLKSIEDNPDSADLYALSGSFYTETGNTKKAIEFYEKVLELNPNNQAVRDELTKLNQVLK